MNTYLVIPITLLMTLAGACGALFFKKAMARWEQNHIVEMLWNPYLYYGGFCYLFGAGCNIFLLKKMEYSILYPMTSITYIWTMVVSYVVLKEKITKNKLMAVFFIIIGIIVLNIG